MPVMPPPSSHASSCLPNELPRGIFNAAGAAAAATSASNTSSPPLHRSGSLSLNDVANLEREVTAARAEYEGLLHELQKRIGRSLKRAEAKRAHGADEAMGAVYYAAGAVKACEAVNGPDGDAWTAAALSCRRIGAKAVGAVGCWRRWRRRRQGWRGRFRGWQRADCGEHLWRERAWRQ